MYLLRSKFLRFVQYFLMTRDWNYDDSGTLIADISNFSLDKIKNKCKLSFTNFHEKVITPAYSVEKKISKVYSIFYSVFEIHFFIVSHQTSHRQPFVHHQKFSSD